MLPQIETSDTRYRIVAAPFARGRTVHACLLERWSRHLHAAARCAAEFCRQCSAMSCAHRLTAIIAHRKRWQALRAKTRCAQTRFLDMIAERSAAH